ncbi:MAG: ABC transporter transmembrane domain-containing protein [Eubacteriales bacterium]
MFRIFKQIYKMSGDRQPKLILSVILQFFDTFLNFLPIGASLWFYQNYIDGTLTPTFPLQVFGFLVGGILVRIFVRYYMDKHQYYTIYTVFYNERIKIADQLKKINMGYFTDDNIGKITITLTNGIMFIEEHGMQAALTALTSTVNVIVVCIMLFFMDVTVGIIFLITVIITTVVLYLYNKASVSFAEEYKTANENLTSALVEDKTLLMFHKPFS